MPSPHRQSDQFTVSLDLVTQHPNTKLVAWSKLPNPKDDYLSLVVVDLGEKYVVWYHNAESFGFVEGDYFEFEEYRRRTLYHVNDLPLASEMEAQIRAEALLNALRRFMERLKRHV